MAPFAEPSDVRLIASTDRTDEDLRALIDVADARLRQRAPWVDERLARYEANPADPTGVNPVVVASVIAGVVKRFLDNPSGATTTTKQETVGPYSVTDTNSYQARSGEDAGILVVTDADLAALGGPGRYSRGRIGTMRLGSRF